MKKRLVSALAIALVVIASTVAFIACGANSSPEAVAKAFITATSSKNADKAVDCMYFKDDTTKKATKAILEASFAIMGDDVKLTISNVKYEKVAALTEEEMTFVKASYTDTEIQEGEKGTLSYTIKMKGEILGVAVDETDDQEDEIVTIKIDGKWYIHMSFGL